MKSIKIYFLLHFMSLTLVSYGVTLPSHSFFGVNELYEENQDYIEYSVGTRISNINILISAVNSTWGDACLNTSLGEQGKCQDCCGETWELAGYKDEDEVSYDTCISMCGGGPSLPLGSVLCFIPFVLVYIGIKIIKSKSE